MTNILYSNEYTVPCPLPTFGVTRAPIVSDPSASYFSASVLGLGSRRDRGSSIPVPIWHASGQTRLQTKIKIRNPNRKSIKVGMVGYGVIKKYQVFGKIQIF